MLVLPYYTAKRSRRAAHPGSALVSLLGKLALTAGLTVLLQSPAAGVSDVPVLRHMCYAVYIWMITSINLDAPVPLAGRLLGGLPLQPAMDEPYRTTSVREFWGVRYNQIVSAVLNDTVYAPVVEGRWIASKHSGPAAAASPGAPTGAEANEAAATADGGAAMQQAQGLRGRGLRAGDGAAAAGQGEQTLGTAATAPSPVARTVPVGASKPSALQRAAGLTLAFVVSGVMHEVCIGYMCGTGRLEGSYRMLAFFLLQPLLVLGQEAVAGRAVPRAWRGHWLATAVQAACSWALILWAAESLFWPPFEACRIDVHGLQEIMGGMEAALRLAGRGRP